MLKMLLVNFWLKLHGWFGEKKRKLRWKLYPFTWNSLKWKWITARQFGVKTFYHEAVLIVDGDVQYNHRFTITHGSLFQDSYSGRMLLPLNFGWRFIGYRFLDYFFRNLRWVQPNYPICPNM